MNQSLAEYIKSAHLDEENYDDKPSNEPEFHAKQQFFFCTSKHFEDRNGDEIMDVQRKIKNSNELDINDEEDEEDIDKMYAELNKHVITNIKPSKKMASSMSSSLLTNKNSFEDTRPSNETLNKRRLITFDERPQKNKKRSSNSNYNSNDNNRRADKRYGGDNGNGGNSGGGGGAGGGRYHPYTRNNNNFNNNNNNGNRNNNNTKGRCSNFNDRGDNTNNCQSNPNQFNGSNNNMNAIAFEQQQRHQQQQFQQQQLQLQQQQNDLFNINNISEPLATSSSCIPSLMSLNTSNMNDLNLLGSQQVKILVKQPNGHWFDINGETNNSLNAKMNPMNLSTNYLQNMNFLGNNGLGNILNLNAGAVLPIGTNNLGLGMGNATSMLALNNNTSALNLVATPSLPLFLNNNNINDNINSLSALTGTASLQLKSKPTSTVISSSLLPNLSLLGYTNINPNNNTTKSQTLGTMLGITQEEINNQSAGDIMSVMRAVMNKINLKIVPQKKGIN